MNSNELIKKAKLKIPYGPMYLDFDEYPPYRNALPESFEIKININLRFCHGYPNSYGNYKKNTWVKKDLGHV